MRYLMLSRNSKKVERVVNKPTFPYRNPITGEYPEKEINPFSLRKLLEGAGFEVSFIPYFYSSSFSDLEMTVKRFSYLDRNVCPHRPSFSDLQDLPFLE